MTRRVILNLGLLGALIAVVTANWALRPDLTRPNLEFAPDMAHSPRYNAYAANPTFNDGKTLQRPPEHTIAREESAPRPSEKRGEFVFQNFCVTCHGATGLGNGPVSKRGFPPPPSLLAEKTRKYADTDIFRIVTSGQNNMPSYASQLSKEDRLSVIMYVRALQTSLASSAPAMPKGGS